VHVFLASVALQKRLDVEKTAHDEHFLDAGLAFARSPARAELLPLVWWVADYGSRIEDARPGDDLRAERRALNEALDRFVPFDEQDHIVRALLRLAVAKADDESGVEVPADIADALADESDPVVLFLLAKSEPLGSDAQRVLFDRLLRGDASEPRYAAYLIYDAAMAHDSPRALRQLVASGLPWPGYDDDALELVAASRVAGDLGDALGRALRSLVLDEPRKHDTTEHAAAILAKNDEALGDYAGARRWLDEYESRFGPPVHDFGPLRARLYAEEELYPQAADAMLASIRRGGTDYTRYYDAAKYLQKSDQLDEATRVYQFYLVRVEDRARGAWPFGPPAGAKELAIAYAKVWGHFCEITPRFFAAAALKSLLELLAVTAAALLAAARLPRARSFLLPALLAAEVVFFAGLFALELGSAGGGLTAWLWLSTAAGRAFVLVGGGLYLSAMAGLPRHGSIPAWALVTGCTVAAALGRLAGAPPAPRYVLQGMPAVARLGELGLFPQRAGEIPALVVALVHADAALFLVWPALAFAALNVSARHLRAGGGRPAAAGAALAAAALFAAAASPFAFLAAIPGAIVLVAARVRGGAIAPFLLHGAFVAGGVFATLWARRVA